MIFQEHLCRCGKVCYSRPTEWSEWTHETGVSILNLISPEGVTRTADAHDAELVYQLYQATPGYFEIISIPTPTLEEVSTALAAASRDGRRGTELVLAPEDLHSDIEVLIDPNSGRAVVGYLDYTLHYPERTDATVNLLLIHGSLQSRGIGRRSVRDLERRLKGRVKRVLAGIYGQNPRAQRFWQMLGYQFAIDARPVLDWYAKELV